MNAAAGRLLQPADDRSDAVPVVVLSYRAWSRFGFDPSIRRKIMRAIVREPAIDTAIGPAIGIPLALMAGSGLSAQLSGLGGHSPGVMMTAIAMLAGTAVAAAAVPARRATGIDPAHALRGE